MKISNSLKKPFLGRFSALFNTLSLYLLLSFLIRVVLLIWSSKDVDFDVFYIVRAFFTGFLFDLAIGSLFLFLYGVYLLFFPKRWIGSVFDRCFTYFYLTLIFIIIYFSLLAEIPFWDEFGVRFNFIAVDYLIYTYEVVENINQSYPLPVIALVLVGLIVSTIFIFKKRNIFKNTFSDKSPISNRIQYMLPFVIIAVALGLMMKNKQADFSNNLVINELGKNGAFSFVSAFKSNELDYETFYPKLSDKEAYSVVKKSLLQENQNYVSSQFDDISRATKGNQTENPNIILIAIESFSADFLSTFGNKDNLTPNYEKLANESMFFTNLYATGTRTVRGMEALTLSVPPTPGNSIVRRPNNDNLFSVSSIVQSKNYQPYFIYGGDGYFDNMNNFFGGQGFDIVDRDRGNPLSDNIKTQRFKIEDKEVSFENAWGICDEDLYKQSIKYADKSAKTNKPFFQFVMTTSNHKPYTFPAGKIDLPQGERNGAVKYTDYALGKFINDAKSKPWFKNTVFVIVADHCASSAGKWEINIAKHHIPAIIYNLNQKPEKIERLTSQIDVMPTLFGYLGWNYNTSLYGKDINQTKIGDERAFIGNYRTLGMLKGNIFTQIDDRKRVKQFVVSGADKSLSEVKTKNNDQVAETISYYQTASERFKNGKMKMK
ncbi:sulfatase-like hydrolase/transferase [Chryseobacterium sp. Ch-15]|uniref:Sulfatase-like hydrolase/transferase n=1 Tax=Chryseobacterium muglaense TaxID=2893752 RepID=A0A9Q3UW09_9FLAO|nr:alkaline phosphatase family protein [Chryseobacterium muglaense]MBD3906264.1 sulfatase-like hydrolase/transferase [Chryseobacterium muglaense]MCC9036763.1 sulfatase-like hydrolase/transferase [Chryseobacterium muglaense]MCM2555284.1 sulfatase-like hydrolase/transferase [Chryseobacterium muglaense]